jgi:hypothetical protein
MEFVCNDAPEQFIQASSSIKKRIGAGMKWIICALFISLVTFAFGGMPEDRAAFDAAADGQWQEVFSDSFTGSWSNQWFLDGEIGSIENSTNGMKMIAGPEFRNDAHHMVLWTKENFAGDLKIEYDFTRLDSETRAVCILYIEATGSGKGPYAKDIAEWNELRRVPTMSLYFNHMNLLHVSYAAYPNEGEVREQYIRGRRYMPESGKGLKGTDFLPDYFPKGLFEPGVPHHLTFIKKGGDVFMRVQNGEQDYFCRMSNTNLPPVTEGRLALRQMYTRSSVYKNFRVSTPK